MLIEVRRTSDNSNSITGELFVDGAFIAHTLELPWLNNQSYVSSIPAGTYGARLRYDHSDGWRIEFLNVPQRTSVQIHVGNFPSNIEGCVLVGNIVVNSQNRLEQSASAYAALRKAFYGSSDPASSPNVSIQVRVTHYPQRTQLSGQDVTATYLGSGRWSITLEGETQTAGEEKRDLQHIYLRGGADSDFSFCRLPLFGGQVSVADTANGPWDADGEPILQRQY